MSFDAVIRATLRNFSTLALVVATFVLPIHLVYSFVFRNVIAVSELHPYIESFPPHRQVRSVGAAQLTDARLSYVALTLIELALIPLLARACTAVLETEERGGIPTVTGALRAMTQRRRGWMRRASAVSWRVVAASAVFATVVGALIEWTGLLATSVLPDRILFVGVALVQAAARSAAAPFFLVGMVWADRVGRRDQLTT